MLQEQNLGPVILASGSPRRKELLAGLLTEFTVQVSQEDESLPAGIGAREAVEMLALKKARSVARRAAEGFAAPPLVIGADTVVALEGVLLGKPRDAKDAARMLRLLSGQTHEVCTGVALCRGERERSFVEVTRVMFAPLDEAEIAWYLSTKEPFDKAGAYGIQGYASRFIKGIEGDYFNVMGLPLRALYENLGAFTK